MGKLRYYYGSMNSMKTSTLLLKQFQFMQSGQYTLVLKPKFDTRDQNIVKSRALKDSIGCIIFDENENLFKLVSNYAVNNDLDSIVVFVDEVSFITKEQVSQLLALSKLKSSKIEIFTYGLKTTYKNELFEASEQLLIMADTIEEIKSMCCHCNNKATTHLRYIGDKVTFDGESCIVGDVQGVERYESVCQECWNKSKRSVEKWNSLKY